MKASIPKSATPKDFVCSTCGHSQVKNEFKVTREDKYAIAEKRRTKAATYQECALCGVMRLDDSSDYETVYSEGAYYAVDGDPAVFLANRFAKVISLPKGSSDNLARIERIKSFLAGRHSHQGQKQVLDVGAGMGVFLYKFLDPSWEGTALDLEPHAYAHMKKVLKGVRVVLGEVRTLPGKERFDLITLNRVLEHLFEPVQLLKELSGHLRDGGVLYLEVPDVLSYYEDGPNNEAFGYGHYAVYSPASLSMVAEKAGFQMDHCHRTMDPSGKFTLYGFFSKKTIR